MDEGKRAKRVSQAVQTALNLSHDVKNILQAIKGGTDIIDVGLQRGDIERTKRAWNILKKNLDRIEKLVLDMLEYSKETKLILTDCKFNDLVHAAQNDLLPEALEKGVSITVHTDNTIGSIPLDTDKINDVILNLIINAIDAVPQNTGEISLTTKLAPADNQFCFHVTDNGPGIKDIDSIFEPFHTTKAKVGTGLGLPIVKKIITQHAGTIKVKSTPGSGTTFTVTLPTNNR